MYRALGVLTVIAMTVSGCLTTNRDDSGFAEEPVPIVDAEPDPQLAALPPVPSRRPDDMSGFISPEEAYLAEKKIDDLVSYHGVQLILIKFKDFLKHVDKEDFCCFAGEEGCE